MCTFATTAGFAFFLCGLYKYFWEVAASFDLSVKREQHSWLGPQKVLLIFHWERMP